MTELCLQIGAACLFIFQHSGDVGACVYVLNLNIDIENINIVANDYTSRKKSLVLLVIDIASRNCYLY